MKHFIKIKIKDFLIENYEDKEFNYEDDWVKGLIRIVNNDVEILDWNSTYKEKGGTEKSLKGLRDTYVGRIRAVDAGFPGETSFEYWKHMLEKGLIDEIKDDNGKIWNG